VLAERTIALARELGDRSAESKALWNLMILNVFGGGDADEAVEAGERSLEIARELNAREQIAFTLNDLWRPYAAVGDVAAARACLEEARPIWREIGNLPMLCENLIGTAALLTLAGEPQEALALYDEAYATSGEIGNPWGQAYALFNAYLVDVEQGNVGRAMARMRECIQRSEEAGFLIPQSAARADLGVQYARLGQFERATELADRGLEIAKGRTPLAIPMAMVSKAEILFLAGESEQAESMIAEANLGRLPGPVRGAAGAHVDILRGQLAAARGDYVRAVEIADAVTAWLHRHELRQFLPAALLLKSRALIASERQEEADPLLREARSRAEDMGFRRLLWEIDWELSRVAADRGDPAEAAALRAEAASTVSAITVTIDDQELRASFLALPDVRAALSER
jgi:tetratricopeptide (TPR) repeat protein